MLCSFSTLDEQTVERIKALENELGRTIIAYTCLPGEPAPLSDQELDTLRRTEQQLGLSLVALKDPARQEHGE